MSSLSFYQLEHSDSSQENKFRTKSGSTIGFCFTVTMLVTLFSYMAYIISKIYNKDYDIYNSLIMVNDFADGTSQFHMRNYNFLPNIQIESFAFTQEEKNIFENEEGFDVFKEINEMDDNGNPQKVLDLEKLKKYIRPRLKVNSKVDGISSFWAFDYRQCIKEDFEQNGLNLSEHKPEHI